jgi:hypothetical protein
MTENVPGTGVGRNCSSSDVCGGVLPVLRGDPADIDFVPKLNLLFVANIDGTLSILRLLIETVA